MSFLDTFVKEETNVIGHLEPIPDEAVDQERNRWQAEREAFLNRWGDPSLTGVLIHNNEELALANYANANPGVPVPSFITTSGHTVPSWNLLTDPYSVNKEFFYPYVVDRVEKTSGINWAGTIWTAIAAAVATFGASAAAVPAMAAGEGAAAGAAGESAAEMLMFETGGALTMEEAAALSSVLPEAGAAGMPIGDLSMYDFGMQIPEATGAEITTPGILETVKDTAKLLTPLYSLSGSGPGGPVVGQNIDNSNTVTQTLIPITGINVEAPKESQSPYAPYWITSAPGNPIPETSDTYIAGVEGGAGAVGPAPIVDTSMTKYLLFGGLALLILSRRN